MTPLVAGIPPSFMNLIGMAVLLAIFIMVGTFLQEMAKTIYRKRNGNGGKERRAENIRVEETLVSLVQEIKRTNDDFHDFMVRWKETIPPTVDDITEIKRKQERNWDRLFDIELPKVKHGT